MRNLVASLTRTKLHAALCSGNESCNSATQHVTPANLMQESKLRDKVTRCDITLMLTITIITDCSLGQQNAESEHSHLPNIISSSLSIMTISKKISCNWSASCCSIVNIKAVLWDSNQLLITNGQ